MEVIKPFDYEEIHYFGDKYEEDGTDYHLLNVYFLKLYIQRCYFFKRLGIKGKTSRE